MQLEIGQIFGGKYRILRRIGEGGMGEVYEGENIRIRRRVAIKTLHAGVAAKSDTIQRFEREAQAAGRIGSEHIVEVLDLGELPDGTRYMVMEFLEGMTLAQRIRSRGRLTPEEATPIIVQLLDGLGAAHAAGIIHRDLKPANVFLLASKAGQKDFVKILDFGVSKFNVLSGDDAMSMTRTGVVLGTPFYMSPEQAKGATIDPRSDLYSVGVILYESITGQVPYNAETFNELLFKIVLESPPPAESFVPDLDPAFAVLLRKAMAREIGERFQSAAEFKGMLNEWLALKKKGAGALAQHTILLQTTPGFAPGGAGRATAKTAALPSGMGIPTNGTMLLDGPSPMPMHGAPQGAPAPMPAPAAGAPFAALAVAPAGAMPQTAPHGAIGAQAAAPIGPGAMTPGPPAAAYPGASFDAAALDARVSTPGVPKPRGAGIAVAAAVGALVLVGGGAIFALQYEGAHAESASSPAGGAAGPPPAAAESAAPPAATGDPAPAAQASAAPAASAAATAAASAEPAPDKAGAPEPGSRSTPAAPKLGSGSLGGHAKPAQPAAAPATAAPAASGGFPLIGPAPSGSQKGRKISSEL